MYIYKTVILLLHNNNTLTHILFIFFFLYTLTYFLDKYQCWWLLFLGSNGCLSLGWSNWLLDLQIGYRNSLAKWVTGHCPKWVKARKYKSEEKKIFFLREKRRKKKKRITRVKGSALCQKLTEWTSDNRIDYSGKPISWPLDE